MRLARGDQAARVAIDKAHVDLVGEHLRVDEQGAQEVEVDPHPLDRRLAQRPAGPAQQQAPVVARTVHDQLGEQRVVVGGDLVAHARGGVDAHARPVGQIEHGEAAGGGAAGAVRRHRLGIDAKLHRAAAGGVGRRQRLVLQPAAQRQPELEGDQIEARHRLGHRVLDLQARVHLQEMEALALDQELHRADAAIVDMGADAPRGLEQPVAQLGGKAACGGKLDQLLALALEAALPVAEDRHGARSVARDLDLDMARALDQRFGIEPPVAECRLRLRAAAGERLCGLAGVADDADPAAAAAGDGLEHHRPARDLSPNRASVCAEGPTKIRPASRQASAKAGASLRKP